ncbi:hypothetical protein LXA43DRAFT_1101160 [Ganoderma leucocontextum]|nr:hypothetical protein LXA43DRAFT_1101160 [Ganoderma leucocontextum]
MSPTVPPHFFTQAVHAAPDKSTAWPSPLPFPAHKNGTSVTSSPRYFSSVSRMETSPTAHLYVTNVHLAHRLPCSSRSRPLTRVRNFAWGPHPLSSPAFECIRVSALLGSWARVPSLVDEADAIALIKTKLREARSQDQPGQLTRTSSARAGSSKEKVTSHTVSHPVVKSGASPSSVSTRPSTSKKATLPPPLMRPKNKRNVAAPMPPERNRRPGKKGMRVASSHVSDAQEVCRG